MQCGVRSAEFPLQRPLQRPLITDRIRDGQPCSTSLLVFSPQQYGPIYGPIYGPACRPAVCENCVQYTINFARKKINNNNVRFHWCFVPSTNQVDSFQPSNSSESMRSCVNGRALHVSNIFRYSYLSNVHSSSLGRVLPQDCTPRNVCEAMCTQPANHRVSTDVRIR